MNTKEMIMKKREWISFTIDSELYSYIETFLEENRFVVSTLTRQELKDVIIIYEKVYGSPMKRSDLEEYLQLFFDKS